MLKNINHTQRKVMHTDGRITKCYNKMKSQVDSLPLITYENFQKTSLLSNFFCSLNLKILIFISSSY